MICFFKQYQKSNCQKAKEQPLGMRLKIIQLPPNGLVKETIATVEDDFPLMLIEQILTLGTIVIRFEPFDCKNFDLRHRFSNPLYLHFVNVISDNVIRYL